MSEHLINLGGWLGEDEARRQFDLIGGNIYKDVLKGRSLATGDKMMLYEIVRKVLGKDTNNYAQAIGDCVSFSSKNCLEYNTCTGILLRGQLEKFRSVFPPFLYGGSRVWIGKSGGWSDGSVAVWAKECAEKYGVLFSDEEGVPQYSGSVAKSWGRSGPPQEFEDKFAKNYKLVTSAQVSSWEECCDNVLSGRPVAVASNQGFAMLADSSGFHQARSTWNHAMCCIGVSRNTSKGDYAIILNNWSDVHGQLTDFDTGEKLPLGVLRIHAEVLDRMLKQGDSWAYSEFDGFPDKSKEITRAMFDLI